MSPTDGPEQRQQQLPISNEQAFCIIPSIQAGSEAVKDYVCGGPLSTHIVKPPNCWSYITRRATTTTTTQLHNRPWKGRGGAQPDNRFTH